MAHPHLALAVVLLAIAATAAVWLGTILADRGRQVDALLGDEADAGIDILPGASLLAGEQPPSEPVTGRPVLYVISSSHPHTPKGRHRS
jgi:hypothetical protein